jgi:hypothetical protein
MAKLSMALAELVEKEPATRRPRPPAECVNGLEAIAIHAA